MKLGIKYFLLLLIFLFFSIYGLYSVENKNKNSESVSAVNSEILSKYIFRLQENSYDNTNELVPVDKSEDNYSIKNDPFLKVFYVDKNNKIRKFIENSQFAEGGTHVLEYFKEDGNLCYVAYEISFLSEFNSYGVVNIRNKCITRINSVSLQII